MKSVKAAALLLSLTLLASACSKSAEEPATHGTSPTAAPTETASTAPSEPEPTPSVPDPAKPIFKNVSVHDPSVIKVDGTYYVFGSHLASAKTINWMEWQGISSSVNPYNVLIENVYEELKEAFEWAQTDTLWAADVIQLADGKFYMYYNACKGDSPRSAMGIAVSDHIEGPYKNQGLFMKSGMWGQASEDGSVYDATRHPNAVDPDVFYDKDGKLWMVYGSYSGGIFIMEMDPKTGFPLPDQGYGKKLLGANHSRIEAPYILYSPESDYYYLFLSYGGLAADGGYQIRVARSKTPDGPYYDALEQDMMMAKGKAGTFFDDKSIEPYGVKLMGNVNILNVEGEPSGGMNTGYVSPGHNSAYYDEETGKYYLIFHTRFPGRGEGHEVRVHQMFINEEGWPVVGPHRYAGETTGKYTTPEIAGNYKFVNHGKAITPAITESSVITLGKDGQITGAVNGAWKASGDHNIELTIDGTTYKGVLVRQYDGGTIRFVMTFTALSPDGTAIWGSKVAQF